MKKIILFLLVFSLNINACTGIFNFYAENSGFENFDIVYLAGYYTDGAEPRAYYMKNGQVVNLHVATYSNTIATGIFVQGSDVYVSGTYYDTSDKACYWKNGKFIDLHPSGQDKSWANAVFVAGNDLYIAGKYQFGSPDKACYWKNGKFYDLHNPAWNSSQAYDIKYKNGNVYIAGYFNSGGNDYGFYAVNSTVVAFSPTGLRLNGIYKSGNTVYTAGYLNSNEANYFVGTQQVSLHNAAWTSSEANSIAVYGGDIYVGGRYLFSGVLYACYWKNGKVTTLYSPLGPGAATTSYKMVVTENGVFVAGDYADLSQYACYWKDGKFVEVHKSTWTQSIANSIFVVSL